MPLARDKRQNKNGKRIVANSAKDKSMALFLLFMELPSICEASLSPRLPICVWGGSNCPELPPPLRRGSRQEAVTQKIINISHFLCQFSSKNTPVRLRFTSPPLRSQGAMQIQAPPFFSFFSSSTLFSFHIPPTYCSE